MGFPYKMLLLGLLLWQPLSAVGADDDLDEEDEFKITAIEALMSAPPERALPVVTRVLRGDHSDEVKESALFILTQLDSPEASALLVDVARNGSADLRLEAIPMIGIAGNKEGLAALREIYAAGDEAVREAVLEAYLIADDTASVYELALASSDEEELASVVEILAAMGAKTELRNLLGKVGASEGLIEAYAISGDIESLKMLAADESDPDGRLRAIEALGIVGGDEANAILLETYRGSSDRRVRDAALEGMLIADYDEGVIELYRASNDTSEKRMLLEVLTAMGSDALWDIVDEALAQD